MENIFFLHFSLVSIQVLHNIAVVIQAKHWRDINLKLSVYFLIV